MKKYRYQHFSNFANSLVRVLAHPNAFLLSLLLVVAWIVVGLVYRFNADWQTITYSVSALVTFLLIFLLQHTQSREIATIQLKLNELIRSSDGAHNALLDIEQLTNRDYDLIKADYMALAKQAREQLMAGKHRWATARVQMESLDSLLDPSSKSEETAEQEESLRILADLKILDTPPDDAFDRLTHMATQALHVPVALISLVDRDRQWFKSEVGLPPPVCARRETPLSHSFCKHVVALRKPLLIRDAREHPIVRNNPAIAELGVVAYAGIPLVTSTNQVIGSFCAIDHTPRDWTEDEIQTLTSLAAITMEQIERRGHPSVSAANDVASQQYRAEDLGTADIRVPGPSERPAFILIVDDSETNRKLLAMRLKPLGYEITSVKSGEEALLLLEEHSFHLILLDIMMPGMDGEQVLTRIKNDERFRNIPVIMISALDEEESVKRCLDLGAVNFLLKPFDPVQLKELAHKHLTHKDKQNAFQTTPDSASGLDRQATTGA